jgi:hypothetical protein
MKYAINTDSQPCRPTGKLIVLYILLLFLKGIRKREVSVVNGRKHSLNVNTVALFMKIFLACFCYLKAIPVTGHGGAYGCEMSRLPHFLDNWHTYGSEVVSLTHWQPFTPRNIPGTHFC